MNEKRKVLSSSGKVYDVVLVERKQIQTLKKRKR